MSQNALSVVTYVQPSERDSLEKVLDVIGNDVRGAGANRYVSFTDFSTVHFACWVVLRSTPDSANPANVYPDTLVLETNFDGDLSPHLDELVTRGGKALDAVYGHCADWPARGCSDRNAVITYLKQHSVATTAFYVGCPGHTVGDIQNARAVREELETFLDGEEQRAPLSGLTARDILTRIQQYLTAHAKTTPVVSRETLDAQGRRGIRNAIIAGVIGLPVLIVVSPLLLLWYVVLRIHETRDAQTGQSPLSVDPRLFGKEVVFTQNHLTTLVDVKPGKFRLGTLKGVLWLVNILAKTVFVDGQLGGIPSIHFARWLFLEETSASARAAGLIFIAINADLQRQFEFIQQTWLNNPKFNGLFDDQDPMVSNSGGSGTMTIQRPTVRRAIHGLPRFTTVRGGAYFFLPGVRAIRFLANIP